MNTSLRRFHRFNVASVIYLLLVIAWGAFVRATGSGAGCGEHWPLCNGEVLPRPERVQTVIEFAHRLTSGVSLILVVVSFFWSRKVAPQNSLLRKAASISLFAIILEALLGAGLVLLKYVEFDQSVGRAISISLHSVNTLFLLSAVATLAWLSQESRSTLSKVIPRNKLFCGTLSVFLLVAMSGAITALGDTLFPAESLSHGLAQDFAPGAHFLVQLRVIHPILAITWIMVAFLWSKKLEDFHDTPIRSFLILGVTLQLILGIMNWILLAPVWMQIVHLLVADLVFLVFWISGLEYEVRKGPQQT